MSLHLVNTRSHPAMSGRMHGRPYQQNGRGQKHLSPSGASLLKEHSSVSHATPYFPAYGPIVAPGCKQVEEIPWFAPRWA